MKDYNYIFIGNNNYNISINKTMINKFLLLRYHYLY